MYLTALLFALTGVLAAAALMIAKAVGVVAALGSIVLDLVSFCCSEAPRRAAA